ELKHIPMKILLTIKKSSILFVLGLLRLVLVSLTNYHFSHSEYGMHWNFFFTIFFVKLLACPFDLFIRKSSLRSFLLSVSIGILYQYFLSQHHYSQYLLDAQYNRVTFVDKNKEGIFSLFGYLAIYFAGEAVCYRLKYLVKQSRVNLEQFDGLKVAIKCVASLAFMSAGYWIAMEIGRRF
ncbi:unnamed protein product, partial [Sphagnum jensenii]